MAARRLPGPTLLERWPGRREDELQATVPARFDVYALRSRVFLMAAPPSGPDACSTNAARRRASAENEQERDAETDLTRGERGTASLREIYARGQEDSI